jgi:alpha-ketoglutarate-dependent taurine dioxygenase
MSPQDYFNDKPNRPPIDTHHPAVRTHPVTGLKSLNVNLTYCTGFAELKKAESDALLQFLNLHIHSSDDHYVRWKWAVGSIALWDNVRQLNTEWSNIDIPAESYASSSHPRELPFRRKERD